MSYFIIIYNKINIQQDEYCNVSSRLFHLHEEMNMFSQLKKLNILVCKIIYEDEEVDNAIKSCESEEFLNTKLN